jgi:hypothetical protein
MPGAKVAELSAHAKLGGKVPLSEGAGPGRDPSALGAVFERTGKYLSPTGVAPVECGERQHQSGKALGVSEETSHSCLVLPVDRGEEFVDET